MNRNVTLVASDGVQVDADRNCLANASGLLRNLVEGGSREVPIPGNITGDVLSVLVKVISGEIVVDLWNNENQRLKRGAETLGILTNQGASLELDNQNFCLLDQVLNGEGSFNINW